MEKEKDEIEIDLLALALAVWRKIWLVMAMAVLGAAVAFSYAEFLVTPLYQAKAMMYVNNSAISLGNASFSISSGELSAAQSLVDTYIVIMKSRLTLDTVNEKIKAVDPECDYTYEQLSDMITAGAVNGTEIFEIVVTNPDNQKAELIANTIADVLPKKIANIVEGSSVRIVDYAIVPAYPVSPSVTKYTAIGLLLGGMLSVGIIVVMELMNESIRSEDYLLQTYDLPILAVVPAMGTTSKSRGISEYQMQNGKEKE